MPRRPHNRTMPPFHQPLLPRIQKQLNFALYDDPVVDAHGTMDPAYDARTVVDVAEDGAAGEGEAWRVAGVGLVVGDVEVVLEVCGKGGGSVC